MHNYVFFGSVTKAYAKLEIFAYVKENTCRGEREKLAKTVIVK